MESSDPPGGMSYDFDICKNCGARSARPRYRLRSTVVRVCPECDLHYIEYLDPGEDYDGRVDPSSLTPRRRAYFHDHQHHDPGRFERHVDLVCRRVGLAGLRVLDVGCGGGLFLSLVESEGARGTGVELWDPAVAYARETYGLDVHKYPVEHPFWRERYPGRFDAATLWDVIEHVNFPVATLRAVHDLLVDGGRVFIDTPCRDAFFHRLGVATYRASLGRFPTLLNTMYSSEPFGHKQILSVAGIRDTLGRAGFEVESLEKIYELSCPCESYLTRLLGSSTLARALAPLARAVVSVTRVRNKMIVVARKKPVS